VWLQRGFTIQWWELNSLSLCRVHLFSLLGGDGRETKSAHWMCKILVEGCHWACWFSQRELQQQLRVVVAGCHIAHDSGVVVRMFRKVASYCLLYLCKIFTLPYYISFATTIMYILKYQWFFLKKILLDMVKSKEIICPHLSKIWGLRVICVSFI